MAWYNPFSWGEKAQDNVLDKDNGLLAQVGGWIGNMNFTEEEQDEYLSVTNYYIVKIARLDDKDQNLTEDEFKKELNILINKQNAELIEILTNDQYELHSDIYDRFLNAAFKRWGLSE